MCVAVAVAGVGNVFTRSCNRLLESQELPRPAGAVFFDRKRCTTRLDCNRPAARSVPRRPTTTGGLRWQLRALAAKPELNSKEAQDFSSLYIQRGQRRSIDREGALVGGTQVAKISCGFCQKYLQPLIGRGRPLGELDQYKTLLRVGNARVRTDLDLLRTNIKNRLSLCAKRRAHRKMPAPAAVHPMPCVSTMIRHWIAARAACA